MDKVQCIGMIVGSFLFHFMAMGMSLSFGILYSELHTEFDILQSKAAWIASLFTGLIGVAGVPVSYFVTLFGERKVTIAGSLVLTCGMLTSSFVESFDWLYLTYGLLGGLGASTSMLPTSTIIMKSFNKNSRLAMAICATGTSVGGLVLPPLLSFMIDQYGWRGTYILLAGMALQTLPGSLFYVNVKDENPKQDDVSSKKEGRQNQVLFGKGLTDQQIYIVLMTQGAGYLVGRLVPSLVDKVLDLNLENAYIVTLLCGTMTSSLFYVCGAFIAFSVLATLNGFVVGAFLFWHISLIELYLDKDHVDVGFGWICTLEGVAVITGMPLAGLIIDTTKTQGSGFLFAAGVLFVSMVLALITKFSVYRRVALKTTRL